ncbi:ABC transporter ATP-binding protein [Candidatus Fermentibacteria bacterium]|nr:ABC transporter ATP-binding protein [Candidatus Fermentibacteria bacterium]
MMAVPLVQVDHIRKRFGSIEALVDVAFSVEEGEVFGLLGPNGAGKTTTVRVLTGVLSPDAGRVTINGEEISPRTPRIRRNVGVVPQQITVYEELTAHDNLRFWGRLYGMGGATLDLRIDELLAMVGLETRAKDRVATYSGGMKRRLNLCMGLIHRPKVLVLDEPTLGIDPQARILLLDRVRGIAAEGTAVLYTTHYLEEAEAICSRIAIIDHGRVLAQGTLEELLRVVRHGAVIRLQGTFAEADGARLDALSGLRLVSRDTRTAVLEQDGDRGVPELLHSVLNTVPDVSSVMVERPTLQSVFIQLTGRELRE